MAGTYLKPVDGREKLFTEGRHCDNRCYVRVLGSRVVIVYIRNSGVLRDSAMTAVTRITGFDCGELPYTAKCHEKCWIRLVLEIS